MTDERVMAVPVLAAELFRVLLTVVYWLLLDELAPPIIILEDVLVPPRRLFPFGLFVSRLLPLS